ncbi:MAG TPA: hypothetical protein PL181_17075 [bacterium]|nr:hypothetical protein [bacterium]
MPRDQQKKEQVYGADDIAEILRQIMSKQIRATIELRHDGSGKDLFTFYFTKINAADLALK